MISEVWPPSPQEREKRERLKVEITWTVIINKMIISEDDLKEKPKSFFYLPAKAGRFRRPKPKTNNAIPFV